MNSISIVVATYGDPEWKLRSDEAAESARDQTCAPLEVIQVHGDSLHEARNQGAEEARGKWLVFLDADDSLDRRFVEFMEKRTRSMHSYRTLTRPAIRLTGAQRKGPHVLPRCNLYHANFMIIGTMVSKKLFMSSGGFRDLPVFEDWDLWIRCARLGASFDASPRSIYNVKIRKDGRNSCEDSLKSETVERIRNDYSFRHGDYL